MISPKASLAESVTDILASAPDKFVLVGTSYAGNLALEIAIAAPERVTALWLMGCNPGVAGLRAAVPGAAAVRPPARNARPANSDATAAARTKERRLIMRPVGWSCARY